MTYWDVGNFHGGESADSLLNKDYLDRGPSLEDRARAYRDAPELTAMYRERCAIATFEQMCLGREREKERERRTTRILCNCASCLLCHLQVPRALARRPR